MKTLCIGITVISILALAYPTYADYNYRGKSYGYSSVYFGPSMITVYSDSGIGVKMYIKSYGRHFRGYDRHSRGYGRHYRGYGKYYWRSLL